MQRFGSLFRDGRLCVLAAVLAALPEVSAQVNQEQRAQINNLLVMVRATLPEKASAGAGIVFSAEPGQIFLVTPKDLVEPGGETAKSIDVEFYWNPGKRVQAQIVNMRDSGLGFIVLSVPISAPPELLRFDILGDPAALRPGDPVNTLAHQNGRFPETAARPGVISKNDGIRLFFLSDSLLSESEGSALVDDKSELIGMVRSGQDRRGEALAIDRVVLWLKANRQSVDLRPRGALSPLEQFESEIRHDVTGACSSLGQMTRGHVVQGETVLPVLAGPVGKVEADAHLSGVRSDLIATMYRCLGAEYLIDSKLEVFERIPIAVPFLERSLSFNPDQPLLERNIAFLLQFAKDGRGHTGEYIRNVFQVIDGKDIPASASIAEQMTEFSKDVEFQAKQWLLQEATDPSIQDLLDDLRIRLKHEGNIDATVEVTSRKLEGNLVEVNAKVGRNSFSWTVDYPNKSYTENDEFTRKIMAVSVTPKQ